MQKPGRRKTQQGMVFALAALFLLVLCISALTAYALSNTITMHNDDSAQKAQAIELAEAGANQLFAEDAAYGDANTSLTNMPTSIGSTAINGTAGTTGHGTYTASVLGTSVVTGTSSTTTTITIQGQGTAPNGTTKATVTFQFTETQATSTGGSSSSVTFSDAGIAAGSDVTLSGNSNLNDSSGGHDANVLTNGNLSVTGSASVDGASTSNATVTVDGGGSEIYGSLTCKGNVTVSGSGQINGSVSTLGDVSLSSGTIDGSVTAAESVTNQWGWIGGSVAQNQSNLSLTTTSNVPTAAAGGSMDTAWKTAAQVNTVTSSPWPNSWASSSYAVTGPLYYKGNVTTGNGMSYSISPPANAKGPTIMYIDGNLDIGGGGSSITNNGVVIVCSGTITIEGGSYSVPNANLANSGLISLSTSANAITVSGGFGSGWGGWGWGWGWGGWGGGGGSSTGVGLMWAASGGVNISGGSTINGSVVAASTVTLSNGSTINYTKGFNSSVNVGGGGGSSSSSNYFTSGNSTSYYRSL